MPQLTVNGNVFNYPDAGASPGWGPDASDWAAAVTDVLSTLLSSGDIVKSSAAINDNVSVASNINLLSFDGNQVWAASVPYVIQRGTETQAGTLYLKYSSASSWSLTESRTGDVGVFFSILGSGQVQYTSTSTGSSGTITFSAKTLGYPGLYPAKIMRQFLINLRPYHN